MTIAFSVRTVFAPPAPLSRRFRRLYCLLGLLLGYLGALLGVPAAQSNIAFTRYSVDKGLSQVFVTSILQDRNGLIWVGTANGLNRFDGYTFTSFHHDGDDPSTLSGNHVTDVAESPDGTLWVATNNGLNRKRLATQNGQQQFIRYQNSPDNSNSLGTNRIRSLAADTRGRVWVGTANSLGVYNPQTDSFQRVKVKTKPLLSQDAQTTEGLPYGVNEMYWGSDERLWVAYDTDGLYSYRVSPQDPTSLTLLAHYPMGVGDPRALTSEYVNGMVEDGRGNLWISLWEGGACRLDLKTGTIQRFRHNSEDPSSLPPGNMMGICVDRNGSVWLADYGQGIISIIPPDRENEPYSFALYGHDPNDDRSLSDNSVWDLYCDRSGVLWAGTEFGGLNRFVPMPHFKHYELGTETSSTQALLPDPVTAIQEDRSGNLWIGYRPLARPPLKNGLTLLTQGSDSTSATRKYTHFVHDPNNPDSLIANAVATLFEDSRGRIWVGTDGSGVDRVEWDGKDPKTVRFRHYPITRDETGNSLDATKVLSIYEDAQGVFWLGTWDCGLIRADFDRQRYTRILLDPQNKTKGRANEVRKIVQDTLGRLWIGTGYAGLFQYDPKTEQVVHFQKTETDPDNLWDDRIYSLLSAPDGAIWIASRNGIGKWNARSQKFVSFGLERGIPYRETYGLLADFRGAGKNYIWVSTLRALARFDVENEVLQNYEYLHQKQITEFQEGAYYQSREGEMFFGGTGGILRFRPASFDSNPIAPRIAITDFRIFNHSIPVGAMPDGRTLLSDEISKTTSLTLSYRDYDFTIELALLDYTDPDRNRYRYRLEGFDKDWIEVDSRRRTPHYMNLTPGHYRFRAQGANCHGAWSKEDAVLTLQIESPFWMMWWFQSLCVGTAGLLIFGGYRWRTNRIRRRNLDLQGNNQMLVEQIAERERVEEKLRQSEERYRALVSNLPAIIFSFDPDTWEAFYISDAVLNTTGYEPVRFMAGGGQTLNSLVVADDRPILQDSVREALANRRSFSVEFRILDKEGRIHWFYARGQGVYDPGGATRQVDGAIFDITEKKAVESRLYDSEMNLAITMDSINEGVVAIDRQGRIVRMNPVAEQMTGWEQRHAIGCNFGEVVNLVQTESRLPVNHQISNHGHGFESPAPGQAYQIVSRVDGRERRVSWSVASIRTQEGESVGSVFVFHDETEKYGLEEELRQAQKMESLGRLAGGVAHDFNNLLGPILGYAEMIQFNSEPGSALNEQADVIMRSAERAAGLTRQLLSFSRKGKTVSVEVEMHQVLDDAIGMLRRTIDPRIELRTYYGAKNAHLMGDPSQLQNAILNLAINARDAMPQGGILDFSTRDVALDAAYCARQPEPVDPGDYLEIRIGDTGVGMDRETLGRIFEPFFTTKELGKGTGLGMASVYSAVKQHQGLIQVQSELGRGTLITLLLPLDEKGEKTETPSGDFSPHGEGLILIVDDEKAIRNVLDDALQQLGYSTILACDGQEGVDMFQQYHTRISAVILDYMMPKRNGREVLAFMRHLNPAVPVLIASGYSFGADEKTFLAEGAVGYIEKPFRIQTIAEKIQEAIQNRG